MPAVLAFRGEMLRAPQLLIAFRAACAPAIAVLACFDVDGRILGGVVLAALLSDIFDGVLARRAGVASPALRSADTVVDTLFYTAAGIALNVAVPGVYDDLWLPLVLLIVVHVSRTTFELTKYGRVAAYHMWSSKLLGVLVVTALTVSFAIERPTLLLGCALWLAVANELEGFVASALLRRWRADVPTLLHAVRFALDGK